jgi:hypothetical protein
VKAVLFVKENEKTTNSEYQKGTATYELTKLVDRYNLLEKSGTGAGTYYHALSRKNYALSRIIM